MVLHLEPETYEPNKQLFSFGSLAQDQGREETKMALHNEEEGKEEEDGDKSGDGKEHANNKHQHKTSGLILMRVSPKLFYFQSLTIYRAWTSR